MTQYWVSLSEIIWNIGLVIAGSVGLTEDPSGLTKSLRLPFRAAPRRGPSPKRAKPVSGMFKVLSRWNGLPGPVTEGRLSFVARGLLDRKIPEALCLAAPNLRFDAAFAGREARTGFHPKFRLFCRGRDQA